MRLKALAVAAVALMVLASGAWGGSAYNLLRPIPYPMTQGLLGFKTAHDFVAWAGCPEASVSWLNIKLANAWTHTSVGGPPEIYYTTGLDQLFHHDSVLRAAVLAHETRHCVQVRERPELSEELDVDTVRAMEYDAEAYAHKILRLLGYDADKALYTIRHTFAQVSERTDDAFTPTHGSAHSITAWAHSHDGLPWVLPQGP